MFSQSWCVSRHPQASLFKSGKPLVSLSSISNVFLSFERAGYGSERKRVSKGRNPMKERVIRVITLNFSENGILNNLVFARTAFPGGYRNNNNGNYNNIGSNGYFWSSSENNSNNAWKRKLNYNNSEVNRNNNNKKNGFSVRCVRDLKHKDMSTLSGGIFFLWKGKAIIIIFKYTFAKVIFTSAKFTGLTWWIFKWENHLFKS